MKEKYLKPKEVAEALGISTQAARKRMKEMPGCINVGGGKTEALRVPESGLETWKEEKIVSFRPVSIKIARRPIGRQRGA